MKIWIFIFVSVFVISGTVSIACSADDLKFTKDKDGTTWSAGSEEARERRWAEEEREKDRAWDMLRNSSVIFDKRTTE